VACKSEKALRVGELGKFFCPGKWDDLPRIVAKRAAGVIVAGMRVQSFQREVLGFRAYTTRPNHARQFNSMTMETHFSDIIKAIGEDIHREGLIDTPKRAAAAFKFLNRGYELTLEGVLNNAIFEADTEDMVIVKDIELYSLCEHHLLPFIGKCHVAYLPKGKVMGLSKVARVVDMYARRLQIQERLTKQIADAIQVAIDPRGVAVVIEAKHLCMMMRGVEKQNSVMTTSSMIGIFREHISTRSEFLNLINR
jgi:GTP cyclohydrolase I